MRRILNTTMMLGLCLPAIAHSQAVSSPKPPPPPPLIKRAPPPPPPPPPIITTPPIMENSTLIAGSISDDDYPSSALRNEEQAVVTARYTVNERGIVSECNATSDTGSVVLETTTCSLMMRRFRFKPARDYSGKPVASSKVQRVSWVLPEEELPQFAPGEFTAIFTIEADGSVTGCKATGNVRYDFDAETYCTGFTRAEPILGKAGFPARRTVTVRMSTRIEDPDVPVKKRK